MGFRVLHGYPLPQTATGAALEGYRKGVQRLVRDIKLIARELREAQPEPFAPEQNAEPSQGPSEDGDANKVKIVLAASTSATKAETDRLERVYINAGYGIIRLDRFPAPLTADAIRGALEQGGVFVQLIGPVPGRRLEDFDDLPSTIAQHRLAAASEIDVATWMPQDFDASECGEDYAEFLKGLVTHRSSFEDFEAYSLKLAEKNQKELDSTLRQDAIRKRSPDSDPPLVSIDASRSDRVLSDKIQEALDDYVIVDHVPYNASMESLSEAVRDNDAIILVYGEEVEGQKRAKAHFRFFRRWRRTVWNEENQRFEIAFGDAAPETSMPCPSGPGIHVIRIDNTIDTDAMRGFLQALGVEVEQPVH